MSLVFCLHPDIRVVPCPLGKHSWEERLVVVSFDQRIGSGDEITAGELVTIDDDGGEISTTLVLGTVNVQPREISAMATGGDQHGTYLIRARIHTLQGDRHEGKVIVRVV